jgi:benzoyl-CoA reductase/2-hydroxyglutaryl-CoA dehydratase subunit BcrC/BadD/HgdB
MGEILDVPVFIHEQKCSRVNPGSLPVMPYDDPDFREALISAEVRDNEDMIAWISDKLKRKIDWDKVIEAFYRHNEMRRLWNGLFELRKAIPSPMPSEDMVSALYPGYCLAGTQEAVDFYRDLYAEVKDRIDKKLCVIPQLEQEKYRLFWGGIGIWQYIGLYKFVQNFGAVFVAENQYYRDAFQETETDPQKDPLRAMAERHFLDSKLDADRAKRYETEDLRCGLVLQMIDEYECDGAVLHFLISCRPVVIGWTNTHNIIRERSGVPTLPLESDMCDPRSVSPAEIRNQAERFLEAVDNCKQTR